MFNVEETVRRSKSIRSYDTHYTQRKAGKLNNQREGNILLYNANTLSGNLYGTLPSIYRKKLQNVHNLMIQYPR